jgi:hypothetical protein
LDDVGALDPGGHIDRLAGLVERRTLFSRLVAAAFVVAAAWFWLAIKGVTMATAPRIGPGVAPQQALRIYYRWLVTTLPQERYYTSIAIVGFACLAAAAVFHRDWLGRDRALARSGALAAAGALLWVTGSILELGGHHAVGLMATHANPIQTTNSIAFTIDTIADAFALATFTLIGTGMLAFAAAARRPGHRAWAGATAAIAVAMLVTAGTYASSNDDLSDLMLFASGIALLPGWLIWVGRIGGTDDLSPNPR